MPGKIHEGINVWRAKTPKLGKENFKESYVKLNLVNFAKFIAEIFVKSMKEIEEISWKCLRAEKLVNLKNKSLAKRLRAENSWKRFTTKISWNWRQNRV